MLNSGVIRDEGEDLKPGEVGAFIHIHPNEEAYVAELLSLDGETVAIATVLPSQARTVTSQDVTHARTVPATA